VHVVHIYKDYAPVLGGIEGHLHTLSVGQVKRGLRVSVVVCQPRAFDLPENEVMQGVHIYRLPRDIDVASAAFSWKHASIVRQLQPDILHLQMPWPPGDVVSVLNPTVPLVISYQSDIIRQKFLRMVYAPLLRHTLDRSRAIITTSPSYAQTSPWLKSSSSKIHVVPLGIHPRQPADNTLMAIWRTRLPFPFLLWVGRMRYYKGLPFLIEAMQQLPAEVRLVFVGDGPMQRQLAIQVEHAGLNGRVLWLGDCSDADITALHVLARIFVFPSHVRAEAFGLSLLEALAAGLPAISCELGTGTSFVNQHRRTGLVVPPANPHALAHAIQLLWYDTPLRTQMGLQAQRWANEQFNADQMIDDIHKIYAEIVLS